jgi:hypothetical protein
MKWIKNDIAVA